MNKASRVRVGGPLGLLAGRFRAELASQGYSEEWTVVQLWLLAGLSRWLSARGLGADELRVEHVDEYFAEHRARRQMSRVPATVSGPLVTFLVGEGLLVVPVEPSGDPVDMLVARFCRHLAVERGLRTRTIGRYQQVARLLLRTVGPAGLELLDAETVTTFVVDEAGRRSAASAGNVVVGLRAFLRFCFVEGLVARRLDVVVPTVAAWRASALPKALEPGVAERLVASCDRRTALGRRDYAVLLCLWRLGLRVGEVAVLGLDDVDWRAGEIVVHGKAGADERLPLPVDVGEAIAGYLRRGRPRHQCRSLFLRRYPPIGPLSPTGVRTSLYRACDKVGIARFGAHRLRHTTAVGLLEAGASLEEVAQVLRHRSIDTTAIYAKIDLDVLATVALPWPGGER